jgi:hypothetical protein
MGDAPGTSFMSYMTPSAGMGTHIRGPRPAPEPPLPRANMPAPDRHCRVTQELNHRGSLKRRDSPGGATQPVNSKRVLLPTGCFVQRVGGVKPGPEVMSSRPAIRSRRRSDR